LIGKERVSDTGRIEIEKTNKHSGILSSKKWKGITQSAKICLIKACDDWARSKVLARSDFLVKDMWVDHVIAHIDYAERTGDANAFNPGNPKDLEPLIEWGDKSPPAWKNERGIGWAGIPAAQKVKAWKAYESSLKRLKIKTSSNGDFKKLKKDGPLKNGGPSEMKAVGSSWPSAIKESRKCYLCQTIGHISRNCPRKNLAEKKQGNLLKKQQSGNHESVKSDVAGDGQFQKAGRIVASGSSLNRDAMPLKLREKASGGVPNAWIDKQTGIVGKFDGCCHHCHKAACQPVWIVNGTQEGYAPGCQTAEIYAMML
jgi:hypothetical protein